MCKSAPTTLLMSVAILATALGSGFAQSLDYGDAPMINDSSGGGAARHEAVGPMLGTSRDTETANLPTLDADGDDVDGTDDEDGVVILDTFPPGGVALIRVQVSGTESARLSGYFDWDRNSHWNHNTNELAINNQLLAPGTHVLSVAVPASASDGLAYARFKLFLGSYPGTPASGYQPSGEVEDYLILIGEPVATESGSWGGVKSQFR